ncbi:MAG: chemotaxis protein CheA [Candidatus Polarisedimenticolia bacterium]
MGEESRQQRERLEREFTAEADDLLDRMEEHLRRLDTGAREGAPVAPLVHPLFRDVHSLKGLATSLGFAEIAGLAHAFEDLLDRLRLGRVDLDGPQRDLLDRAVAALLSLVRARAGRGPLPGDLEELRQRLREPEGAPPVTAADPIAGLPLEPALRASLSRYEEERLRARLRSGSVLTLVRLRLDATRFDRQAREAAASFGAGAEVIVGMPEIGAGADPEPEGPDAAEPGATLPFVFLVAGESPVVPDGGRIAGAPARCVTLAPARPEGRTAGASTPDGPPAEDLTGASASLRVPVTRLDELLARVGDLSVAAAALLEAARVALEHRPEDRLVREVDRLARALRPRLRALQTGAVEARLVPLAPVFNRLARLAGRTARASGKDVDLTITGGETEIDKAVVDAIASPLMHLLLNALDHGLEPPDERRAAGKPSSGRLSLSAFQKGSRVLIEVGDDGRGIDPAAVRAAAESAGRFERGAPFEDRDAHDLIFVPGVSTARGVSGLSGRGVGLDAARSALRRLKGTIEVRSEPGRGTTFTLAVPVSLVLVQALLVRSGGRRYAIPLASVRDSVRIEPRRLRHEGDGEVYDRPEGPLPVRRVDDLVTRRTATAAARYAIVAGDPGRAFGLLVDELIGRGPIVVKPLAGVLRDLPWVTGAAEMADASAVLVLDPDRLAPGGADGHRP